MVADGAKLNGTLCPLFLACRAQRVDRRGGSAGLRWDGGDGRPSLEPRRGPRASHPRKGRVQGERIRCADRKSGQARERASEAKKGGEKFGDQREQLSP